MNIIKKLDDHFEEFFMVVLLVLIACISLVQVIIRNIPWVPSLKWAEEFCRFCWIWSVFLSLPYTIRHGNMLRVSVLLDLLPHVLRKTVNIIVDIIVTASMGFLAFHSVSVVKSIMLSGETSPAMVWPMWIVYSIMLVGFALATLRGVQQTVIHITHFKEKDLSTLEQTMQEAADEAAIAKGAEGGSK